MVNEFYEFLLRVDQDFITSISSKTNLEDYARKLVEKGFVISTITNNRIIGMVVIYCNNFDTLEAYIPFVAVDKSYRGLKISKTLMLSAINYAKELGFIKIGIHTENPVALNLYTRLGFEIKENNFDRKYLELNLR